MDEPTAALTRDESERLLEIDSPAGRRRHGDRLVSHFLEEVLTSATRSRRCETGAVVRTARAKDETPETLVAAMIGRDMSLEFPPRSARPPADAPVVLEVRGLQPRRASSRTSSFTVRAGEIVGLAGLVGSGRTEVARAIFGADRLDAGDDPVRGAAGRGATARAMRRASGSRCCPRAARSRGCFMIRSDPREHLARRRCRRSRRLGSSTGARAAAARGAARAASTSAPRRSEATVATLSGGNQQKVLFAKWLFRRPQRPDRRRADARRRRRREARRSTSCSSSSPRDGMAILLISSEIEEVLGLAHRVLVMRAGPDRRRVRGRCGDRRGRDARGVRDR